jgi:hypothetical protein
MSETLQPTEYDSYYSQYITPVKDKPLLEILASSLIETVSFFESIPNDKLEYKYDTGKWTPKEILQHLTDTERVFSYRALFIARSMNTNLKGFDQDEFAASAKANKFLIETLLEDYIAVRTATITLFKSFGLVTLKRIGVASNSNLSVRACGYLTCGHERHHCTIIKEKYL